MKTLFLLQLFISILFTATHDVVAHPAIARQLSNVTNSGNSTSFAPFPYQPLKDVAAGKDSAESSPVAADVEDSARIADNGKSAAAPGVGYSPAVSGIGNSLAASGLENSPTTPVKGNSAAVPGAVNSPAMPGTGSLPAAPGTADSPVAPGEADTAVKVAAGLAGTSGTGYHPMPCRAGLLTVRKGSAPLVSAPVVDPMVAIVATPTSTVFITLGGPNDPGATPTGEVAAPVPQATSPITPLQPAVHWDTKCVSDFTGFFMGFAKLPTVPRTCLSLLPVVALSFITRVMVSPVCTSNGFDLIRMTDIRKKDPGVQHQFSHLDTQFSSPSVVLEHSNYVQSVAPGPQGNGLSVTFTCPEAFNHAQEQWSTTPDLMLVTYTDGVGSCDDQRTFWSAQDLTYDASTNSIQCGCKEVAIEEAIVHVDMVWGTYNPADNSTTGSGTGSSGGNGGTTGGSSSGPNSGSGTSGPGGSSSGGSGSGSAGSGSGSGSGGSGPGGSGSGPTGGGSGTSGAGNGTIPGSGNSTTGGCGAPPAPTISGFPAATCGATDFDQQLDSAIGYLDFTNDFSGSLMEFAPGLPSTNPADYQNEPTSKLRRDVYRRSKLQRRGFFSSIASRFTKVRNRPLPLLISRTLTTSCAGCRDLCQQSRAGCECNSKGGIPGRQSRRTSRCHRRRNTDQCGNQ